MAKCVDAIIRFNKKYVVDEETGCWNWIGALNKQGYGIFSVNNKPFRAHRFSYEFYNGELKSNLEICHNCHNRKCCNPEHLRQDTRSSNRIDTLKEKKQYSQILSVEDVKQIKKELINPYRGQCTDLAHYYKVSQEAISLIKTGNRWSHVEVER